MPDGNLFNETARTTAFRPRPEGFPYNDKSGRRQASARQPGNYLMKKRHQLLVAICALATIANTASADIRGITDPWVLMPDPWAWEAPVSDTPFCELDCHREYDPYNTYYDPWTIDEYAAFINFDWSQSCQTYDCRWYQDGSGYTGYVGDIFNWFD
tara:strand:+ start:654 stop:1121 length:468 start_codon:yes stop_codon:yes gene_type:complete